MTQHPARARASLSTVLRARLADLSCNAGVAAVAVVVAVLATVACDDGIFINLNDEREVAGTYAIDFTIVETRETIFGFEGCADLIVPGSIEAVLDVTQEDDVVTLGLQGLGLPIRSDLTAPRMQDGAFVFEGTVVAGPVNIPNQPAPVQVEANATVEGTIDGRTGELDLQYEVGAVTCAFAGAIVGERS